MIANNLNGFLVAYSLKSLPQFISYAPYLGNFSSDFSGDISGGGSAVVTRLATTAWTANRTDQNGYTAQHTTSSAVTVTLVQKDVTDSFSELAWAASIPEVLINTFVPGQSMTLANTVVVDLLGSLSGSSTSTNVSIVTPNTFTYFSSSYVANVLDKKFVPRTNRTLILAPDAYQALNFSLSPTYIYGNSKPVQEYENIKVHGFDTYQFGGVKDAPYNVSSSATLNSAGWLGTGLYGFAVHKSALAIAARAPLEVNNGLVTAVNQTDETSGFTMQNRVSYLQTTGEYQLSSTAIYGCAQGNGAGAVVLVI